MEIKIEKPELLAPAGNFEKLEIAIHYGADAVYLAGKDFSLRNFSGNFSDQELFDAVKFAHKNNTKVYLACNIYSRNHEQEQVKIFLEKIAKIKPDAIIASDPGIIMLASEIIPGIDIHLSTQTNTTNYNTIKFWEKIGVKRVNLARELSLEEIQETVNLSNIETEIFIHGAMCISYSGRCILSSFLSNRDGNRGLCSHPCRWKYSVVEEQRPNEYHNLMEDNRGSYIFNSKDLCMIEHIPDLINSGVNSLKIEGRMKGINYLASVVKTYRHAIDAYCSNSSDYRLDPDWIEELEQVYHREYCTGFFLSNPDEKSPNYLNRHQGRIHSFVGKIVEKRKEKRFLVEIRNKLSSGDQIEIIAPKGKSKRMVVYELFDENENPIEHTKPNTFAILILDTDCSPKDIIRKI